MKYRVIPVRAALKWVRGLKDVKGKAIIYKRLERAEDGDFGECKPVAGGRGLQEMVIDYGPGYRLYLGRTGETVYVVVAGGAKGTQTQDIETAKARWLALKERKNG